MTRELETERAETVLAGIRASPTAAAAGRGGGGGGGDGGGERDEEGEGAGAASVELQSQSQPLSPSMVDVPAMDDDRPPSESLPAVAEQGQDGGEGEGEEKEEEEERSEYVSFDSLRDKEKGGEGGEDATATAATTGEDESSSSAPTRPRALRMLSSGTFAALSAGRRISAAMRGSSSASASAPSAAGEPTEAAGSGAGAGGAAAAEGRLRGSGRGPEEFRDAPASGGGQGPGEASSSSAASPWSSPLGRPSLIVTGSGRGLFDPPVPATGLHRPSGDDVGSSHEADGGGGGSSAEGRAAWESAWGDLDEERDYPAGRYCPDLYGGYEGKHVESPRGGIREGASVATDGFLRRFGRCWSETNRKASTKKALIVLFILASALIAIAVAMDTKDAVEEWENEMPPWLGGDNATNEERVGALPEAANGNGGSGEDSQGQDGEGWDFCPPPPNLAGLCSSATKRAECSAECSRAECCFAPYWYPMTCQGEGCCDDYVDACPKPDKDGSSDNEKEGEEEDA